MNGCLINLTTSSVRILTSRTDSDGGGAPTAYDPAGYRKGSRTVELPTAGELEIGNQWNTEADAAISAIPRLDAT